jgi:hypothetical protein
LSKTGRGVVIVKIKLGSIIFLTALTAMIVCSWNTKAGEKKLPFHPGERLVFEVKWAFIPAGEAVLEIFPIETIDGVKSYHFVMSVKTYEFVDLFYKVRDRIESYTDVGMTHSILYKKRSKGKANKDVVVKFDWEKEEALYSDFGEKRDPISIFSGSFDPLSVFYAFRWHDLKENREIQTAVTDGDISVMGKVKVIKREKITVPTGEYDTFLVEPDLKHIGGVFKQSKNAKLQIWVTSDHRHIPIKIKSKVKVGSFVAELVSVTINEPIPIPPVLPSGRDR